jgi:hypothetical protein
MRSKTVTIVMKLRRSELIHFSAALVSFRNQITVAYGERPGIGDARILLVTSWLEKSPGANELFDIWDTGSNVRP